MQWLSQASLLSAAALLFNFSCASVLTPERLLTAPRPGAGIVNPAGTRALVGVKTFSFEEDSFDTTLYQVNIPSKEQLQDATFLSSNDLEAISKNASSGIWLTDDVAAYVDSDSNTLYAKDVSTSKSDNVLQGWTAIGTFPAPIDTIQVARKSDNEATLVFSAQVYGDGDIDAVKKHDESEAVKEWDRVKGE